MKKVLSTVVAAAMGFSMFAAPVTLTVLDYEDLTAPNALDDKAFIWDAFEASHPNIKIERETSFNEAFHQKTSAYTASGNMPDVFYMWPGGKSSVIHQKKLAKDLKPLMEKDGILDDYKPLCVDPANQNGGYLAMIPTAITTSHCFYINKKVLAENGLTPAKTYEELVQQAKVLRSKGITPVAMAAKDGWVTPSTLFSMMIGRFGGPTWANDILTGKAQAWESDSPVRKALDLWVKMFEDGIFDATTLDTSYGEVPGMFAAGKAAYLIDGDWRSGAFMVDKTTGDALLTPEQQKTDVELGLFPAIPGEKYHNSTSTTLGVGYGMSSKIEDGSEKEKAAWELIKWLSGREVQQRRLETAATFPSLKDGIDFSSLEPIALKRNNWYNIAEVTTPVHDSAFNAPVNSVLETELINLAMGNTTVDKVCVEFQNAVYDDNPNLEREKAPKTKKKHWWSK